MPVQPNPYKLVCSKCGFSKVVAPKSDALSPKDLVAMSPVCKNCGEKMANINWTEIIAYILRLIADGLDKKDAINNASSKFNISKDDITRNFKK